MKEDTKYFTNGGWDEPLILFRPVPPAKKSIPAINPTLEDTFLFLLVFTFRQLSFSELHDNRVTSAAVPLPFIDKDGISHPISLPRWFGLRLFTVNREKRGNNTHQCFFRRWKLLDLSKLWLTQLLSHTDVKCLSDEHFLNLPSFYSSPALTYMPIKPDLQFSWTEPYLLRLFTFDLIFDPLLIYTVWNIVDSM